MSDHRAGRALTNPACFCLAQQLIQLSLGLTSFSWMPLPKIGCSPCSLYRLMGSQNPFYWGLRHGWVQHLHQCCWRGRRWPWLGSTREKVRTNAPMGRFLFALSPLPPHFFGVLEEASCGWQHCRESGQGSAAAPEPLAPRWWGLV